jgi:hypothetical protein
VVHYGEAGNNMCARCLQCFKPFVLILFVSHNDTKQLRLWYMFDDISQSQGSKKLVHGVYRSWRIHLSWPWITSSIVPMCSYPFSGCGSGCYSDTPMQVVDLVVPWSALLCDYDSGFIRGKAEAWYEVPPFFILIVQWDYNLHSLSSFFFFAKQRSIRMSISLAITPWASQSAL